MFAALYLNLEFGSIFIIRVSIFSTSYKRIRHPLQKDLILLSQGKSISMFEMNDTEFQCLDQ